jgi:bacterioferritin-associated ferredoxin
MYVCICNAVTESDIDEAIRDGASGLTDLRDRLQVGTCCGACETTAADYLSENLQGQCSGTKACRSVATGQSPRAAKVA